MLAQLTFLQEALAGVFLVAALGFAFGLLLFLSDRGDQ